MARKRYKHKKDKAAPPHLSQDPTSRMEEPSPVILELMDLLMTGDLMALEQYIFPAMIESYEFAEEPEFADLYFNEANTVRVTERWLGKYEKRLKDAEAIDQEKHEEVASEMHHKIIMELANNPFRRDVLNRLKTFLDRMIDSGEDEKLKGILVLNALLPKDKTIWSDCGLISAIYERTLRQALAPTEEDQFFLEFEDMLESEGLTLKDFFKLGVDSEIVQQVERKLEERPEMMQKLEGLFDQLTEQFEEQLMKGTIDLGLYTEEDLDQLNEDILEEFGIEEGGQLPSGEDSMRRLVAVIKGFLGEIMTPERVQQIRKDLEQIVSDWFEEENHWAAALQGELDFMNEEPPEDNSFLFMALMGEAFYPAGADDE